MINLKVTDLWSTLVVFKGKHKMHMSLMLQAYESSYSAAIICTATDTRSD